MVSSRFCRRSRTFWTVRFLWDSGSAEKSREERMSGRLMQAFSSDVAMHTQTHPCALRFTASWRTANRNIRVYLDAWYRVMFSRSAHTYSISVFRNNTQTAFSHTVRVQSNRAVEYDDSASGQLFRQYPNELNITFPVCQDAKSTLSYCTSKLT